MRENILFERLYCPSVKSNIKIQEARHTLGSCGRPFEGRTDILKALALSKLFSAVDLCF